MRSGFCTALPWDTSREYDPHRRCTLRDCACECHQIEVVPFVDIEEPVIEEDEAS